MASQKTSFNLRFAVTAVVVVGRGAAVVALVALAGLGYAGTEMDLPLSVVFLLNTAVIAGILLVPTLSARVRRFGELRGSASSAQ